MTTSRRYPISDVAVILPYRLLIEIRSSSIHVGYSIQWQHRLGDFRGTLGRKSRRCGDVTSTSRGAALWVASSVSVTLLWLFPKQYIVALATLHRDDVAVMSPLWHRHGDLDGNLGRTGKPNSYLWRENTRKWKEPSPKVMSISWACLIKSFQITDGKNFLANFTVAPAHIEVKI